MRQIVHSAFLAECWWFDARHNVDTAADDDVRNISHVEYIPTRPGRIKLVLRDLPISDYSQYTFVDFGSGKGRVLLIAAEYPFRQVQGIELSKELHDQAVANVHSCHNLKRRCRDIECLNINAIDYRLPNENLVLYFFNPFEQSVMEKLFESINASIEQYPRDVMVAMYHPEFAFLADAAPHLRLYATSSDYRLYRSQPRP